jgi:hypothetical protein
MESWEELLRRIEELEQRGYTYVGTIDTFAILTSIATAGQVSYHFQKKEELKKKCITDLLAKERAKVAGEILSACVCKFCNGSGLDEEIPVYFDEDGEKCMDSKLIQCESCHASGVRINPETYNNLKQKYLKGVRE